MDDKDNRYSFPSDSRRSDSGIEKADALDARRLPQTEMFTAQERRRQKQAANKAARKAAKKATRKTTKQAASGGNGATPPGEKKPRRTVGQFFWHLLNSVVPKWGDGVFEWVRKSAFLVALVVMLGSVSYLLNEMVVIPYNYNKLSIMLGESYRPGVTPELPPEAEDFPFPEGMSEDFKLLYYMNPDVRGWLTFKTSSGSAINIDYPVMYSGDNSYYLNHDFQKKKNSNGALFFDQRNRITKDSRNKSLIIYGHNLSNAQMFTRLNLLVSSSPSYARLARTMTMNTLYEQAQYKVFAVMVANTEERDGPVFWYLRTSFTGDKDFLNYVAQIRARSMFDYNDVDVNADDELLVLSTCNSKHKVGFEDGRTVVVARKVRPGESPSVNPSSIVVNEDVIMPYAWYFWKGLPPHEYYTNGDFELPEITTKPTSGTGETSDATTQPSDTPTTSETPDTTQPTTSSSDDPPPSDTTGDPSTSEPTSEGSSSEPASGGSSGEPGDASTTSPTLPSSVVDGPAGTSSGEENPPSSGDTG